MFMCLFASGGFQGGLAPPAPVNAASGDCMCQDYDPAIVQVWLRGAATVFPNVRNGDVSVPARTTSTGRSNENSGALNAGGWGHLEGAWGRVGVAFGKVEAVPQRGGGVPDPGRRDPQVAPGRSGAGRWGVGNREGTLRPVRAIGGVQPGRKPSLANRKLCKAGDSVDMSVSGSLMSDPDDGGWTVTPLTFKSRSGVRSATVFPDVLNGYEGIKARMTSTGDRK